MIEIKVTKKPYVDTYIEDDNLNYSCDAVFSVPEDATCASAVAACVCAVELDSYHPMSIFKALIDEAYDTAEQANLVLEFEDYLREFVNV